LPNLKNGNDISKREAKKEIPPSAKKHVQKKVQ
jgi:hypothetical protein